MVTGVYRWPLTPTEPPVQQWARGFGVFVSRKCASMEALPKLVSAPDTEEKAPIISLAYALIRDRETSFSLHFKESSA